MCTIYYVLIEIEIVTVLYSLRVNAHCTVSRRQVWRHLRGSVSARATYRDLQAPAAGHVTRAHAWPGPRYIRLLVNPSHGHMQKVITPDGHVTRAHARPGPRYVSL